MEFVMPKLDHTMEEGLVAKWFAVENGMVEKGTVLVSIETNKSVLDVESPMTGKLVKIVAQQGDTVPVFGLLAIIE